MSIDPSVFAALTLNTPGAQPGTSVLLIATPPQMPPKVSGEVVNIDRSGQVVIQTDAGEIIIKTEMPLTVGQKVDIKLPPPQLNAPPIATLIPQNAAAAPRHDASTVAQLHPAVVMDLAAPEEFPALARGAASAPLSPVPVNYAPQAAQIPPAQTLFQLIGLSLPATMIPPSGKQGLPSSLPGALPNALQANNGQPLPLHARPLAATGGGALPTATPGLVPLERVQIVFMGEMSEAKTQMEAWIKNPQGAATPQAGKPALSAQGLGAPLLAQLTGLTPQKLPVFEVLPSPLNLQTSSSITQKSQIIVHAPVLMTGGEQQHQMGMPAVMLVRMPATPMLPETLFATRTFAQQAPLLAQMLHDPAAFVPPEVAAPMRGIVPKPNTPQFAAQVILSMLGFSKAEPRAVFNQKFIDALKPEQLDQLKTELQKLPTMLRDGAPPPEGMRFNFPVEMAGQYYMWQMTLRPPDYDKQNAQSGFMTEKPSRFILDLYMSRLGPMQVDGLSYAKARKLDLILRTKESLPEAAKDTLLVQAMGVFDQADLKGTIAFQTY